MTHAPAGIVGSSFADVPEGHNLGTPTTATVTIFDGPGPRVFLSSGEYRVTEQYTRFPVDVQLSRTAPWPVTVHFRTGLGGATPGADYLPVEDQLITVPANTLSFRTEVQVLDDGLDEPNEWVPMFLQNAAGAWLGAPNSASLIIEDNDVPRLRFENTNIGANEGGAATFRVTLLDPAWQPVTVNYVTGTGSATPDDDYVPITNGTFTFPANTTGSRDVTVQTKQDPLDEDPETFGVILSPTNAVVDGPNLAAATIYDDDPPPIVQMLAPAVSVIEDSRVVEHFAVLLSPVTGQRAPSGRPVTFTYRTFAGTAVPGDDYTSAWTSLVLAPGEVSKPIRVAINPDHDYEQSELPTVHFSQATYSIAENAPKATNTATLSAASCTGQECAAAWRLLESPSYHSIAGSLHRRIVR